MPCACHAHPWVGAPNRHKPFPTPHPVLVGEVDAAIVKVIRQDFPLNYIKSANTTVEGIYTNDWFWLYLPSVCKKLSIHPAVHQMKIVTTKRGLFFMPDAGGQRCV